MTRDFIGPSNTVKAARKTGVFHAVASCRNRYKASWTGVMNHHTVTTRHGECRFAFSCAASITLVSQVYGKKLGISIKMDRVTYDDTIEIAEE